MRYFSPSKLNLFFRVLKKRTDGYHEIASVFQAIDVGDFLTFERSSEHRLTCQNLAIPNEENLVWKAIQLFQSQFECPPVHIHLEKRVPLQAGLGGGSANAATALWGLNEWADRPASLDDLRQIGAQIGSDVVFFFSHGSAYCTGRGEKVEEITTPPLSGYLVKPPYGLSTPLVYRQTQVDEINQIDPRQSLEGFLCSQPHYFNDLEAAAFRIEPQLKKIKEDLISRGFDTVSMTGSGTAFFCLGGGDPPPGAIFFRSIQRDSRSWY